MFSFQHPSLKKAIPLAEAALSEKSAQSQEVHFADSSNTNAKYHSINTYGSKLSGATTQTNRRELYDVRPIGRTILSDSGSHTLRVALFR